VSTRDPAYADRLRRKSGAWWKQALDVQAPYRWNLRRLDLGRTLDIGCGIGRHLESLPDGSVGVDHNHASIAEAKRRGLTALTGEEWADSDLNRPSTFDSLLLSHVVEHMSAELAETVVRAYLPCLKPGGKAVFICPQERGYASDPTHERFVELAGLAALARTLGLTPERSYSFPLPRLFGRVFTHNEFVLLATAP
jgi:SAM-dependent methyltransferase